MQEARKAIEELQAITGPLEPVIPERIVTLPTFPVRRGKTRAGYTTNKGRPTSKARRRMERLSRRRNRR